MGDEAQRVDATGPAPPTRTGGEPATAAPAAYSGGLTPQLVAMLQRTAGNRAVADLLSGSSASRLLQRNGKKVSVTGISVNHRRVTVPPEAGLSLEATASPKNATGVKFKVEKGTVEVKDVQMDSSTGKLTVGSGQPGGDLKATAESDDGASASLPFRIIEKPTGLTSTSASPKSGRVYGGEFTHTFSGPNAAQSGLADGRINEKFDATHATTPWGGFDLAANKAGSPGWGITASGSMNAPDNVTIDKALPDVRPSIKSASNPSPTGDLKKGVGFTMTQHLHAQSLPSAKLDDKPFVDVDHVRQLEDRSGVKFVVKAGKDETVQDYEGPPAFRNAKATPATVAASPPRPKAEKGKPTPKWTRNQVTVTADAIPATARMSFSIVETDAARLGCDVDSASGVVSVGDQAGTITVRVSSGARGSHFDEVKIVITAPPPATPTPSAPKKAEADGGDPETQLVPVEPEGLGGEGGRLSRRALARQPAALGENLDVVQLVKAKWYDRAVGALSWYSDDQALEALARLSPEERERLGTAAAAERDRALGDRVARLLKETETRLIAKRLADWDAAVKAGRWEDAVELVNGFSPDDVDRKLADPALTPDMLKKLEIAALKRPGGVQPRVIEKIRARSGTKSGEAFGKLTVDEYRPQHGTPRTRWAMRCLLTFTPDPAVANATKIGFVQTVRMKETATGRANDPIPGHKGRATPSGTTIDRPGKSRTGVYAQQDGGAMESENVLGSSPAPLAPAKFKDVPGWDEAGVTWDYETAVVALEGADAGLVYATMRWGFEVTQESGGVKVVNPRNPAIDDKPGQEFSGAVAGWNKQAAGPEGERTTPQQAPLPTLR